MGDFSSFLQFSTELDDSGRVLRTEAVVGSSGGFVGDCDSKKAHFYQVWWLLEVGRCQKGGRA